MSEHDRRHVRLSEDEDPALAEYRPVSVAALAALGLGLLSPLALLGTPAWVLPLLGLVCGGVALWRIAYRSPPPIGRKAALVGMALSALMGAWAPADAIFSQWLLRREARQFSRAWFDYLAEGRPELAFLLTLEPGYRPALDDRVWDFYREGPRWRDELKDYVAPAPAGQTPRLVRTLLALGRQAKVRYYETLMEGPEGDHLVVYPIYAVTFDRDGGRETFFVMMRLLRRSLRSGGYGWQIEEVQGGYRPEWLEPAAPHI